jgi:rubrerythrin
MNHCHDDSHHHHHEHKGHTHADEPGMPFEEKLSKILAHWIRHNRDHAGTYRDWAQRAQGAGMSQVAELLEAAAQQNIEMNEIFEKARSLVKEKG